MKLRELSPAFKALTLALIIIASTTALPAWAAYQLRNNGDLYLDSATTYIDSTLLSTYIASVAPAGSGVNVTESSFIFWVDTNYYAQNGQTGAITTNADATTLIQTCLDVTPAGGLLFFKPGTYANLNLTVPADGVRFVGSGKGKSTAPYGGTILDILSGGGIDCSNTASVRWSLYFSDMTITGGNHAATKGIHSDNQATNSKFANIVIERILFTGFKGAGSVAIDITSHEKTIIQDCTFGSPPTNGASIMLRSNDYFAGNAKILNNDCWVDSGVTGSDTIQILTSNSNENDNYLISGNHVFARDYPNYFLHLNAASGAIKQVTLGPDNRMEYACLLRCSGGSSINEVNIYGNIVNTGTNLDVAIEMTTQARSWNIHDNSFTNGAGRTSISDASNQPTYPNIIQGNSFYGGGTYYAPSGGPPTNIHHNVGYVTEKSGASSIVNLNTSVLFNHGCSYTPTAGDITITGTSSDGLATDHWISAITSTQVTVTVDIAPGVATTWTFSWAIHKTP